MIDLRSDTKTKPTPEMRRAMPDAAVGDDCAGEDPTVNRLEEKAAQLLGKESALFVPSGTMANQVAVRAQVEHGREIIAETFAHIYNYERAALAALSGVQVMPVKGETGIMRPEDVAAAVRPPFSVFPRTELICIENTSNRGGGSIYPVETVRRIAEVGRRANIPLHLDGARLLNACAAEGVEPAEYTRHVASTTLCLSKGLGAPVGSVIAGDADLIKRCRYFRGQFGGAMRQAGIIAAGGLYALEHNVIRLAEDHAHAVLLGDAVSEFDGANVLPVQTNIVIFSVAEAAPVVDALKKEGVLAGAITPTDVRLVTHLGLDRPKIDRAITALRKVLA